MGLGSEKQILPLPRKDDNKKSNGKGNCNRRSLRDDNKKDNGNGNGNGNGDGDGNGTGTGTGTGKGKGKGKGKGRGKDKDPVPMTTGKARLLRILRGSGGKRLGWLVLGGEAHGVISAGVFEDWGDGAGGADAAGCWDGPGGGC